MARDGAYHEVLQKLVKLNVAEDWEELRSHALSAAADHPDSADAHAFVAHAMRQLGQLEEGYRWAVRAVEVDRDNLFAINRLSLLAIRTERFEEAFAAVQPVLDRRVDGAMDALNLAVTIVNAIHAASHLGRIAEAVTLFSPTIERLDHPDLHFNSACMYALAKDARWYSYMAKALAAGKPKAAFDDPDFDAIRREPRFVALLARDWTAEAAALERSHKQTRDELQPEDFVDPAMVSGHATPGAAAELERHEELECAIDASVDELDGYLVYSDWLQGRANPRGWLIVAGRRCEEARAEDERMLAFAEWASLLHQHAGSLLGPLAPHFARRSRARWRLGFISELVLDLGDADEPEDAGKLLASALALPVCRFLRELSIGDLRADEELDYRPVTETLRRAEPRHLRALTIAPNQFELLYTRLDATGLVERLPALESLVLGATDLTLGALGAPRLRRLAIHTSGLTYRSLAEIGAARWPELADLEIWLGSPDYGGDRLSARDLDWILAGDAMPRLRRLALQNAELTDEICAALVAAPIVARLDEIDLARGSMSDEGAGILIANGPRFAHLARLSVEHNWLSPAAAAALQRALPNVEIGSQDDGGYGPDDE